MMKLFEALNTHREAIRHVVASIVPVMRVSLAPSFMVKTPKLATSIF